MAWERRYGAEGESRRRREGGVRRERGKSRRREGESRGWERSGGEERVRLMLLHNTWYYKIYTTTQYLNLCTRNMKHNTSLHIILLYNIHDMIVICT